MFFDATMVSKSDGLIEFEISIGEDRLTIELRDTAVILR